jgi:hypothetical protein
MRRTFAGISALLLAGCARGTALPPSSTRQMATGLLTASSDGLRLIITCRCFPPYGYGMTEPGTVTNCVRKKLRPRSLSCCSDIPYPEGASWRSARWRH